MSKLHLFLLDIAFILKKEALVDFRKKSSLSAVALFVITSVSLPVFVFSGTSPGTMTAVVLLWNASFFIAITACQKSFGAEASEKTALFLRLCFPTSVVFWGKWLYNFCLITLSLAFALLGFSIGTDLQFYNLTLLTLCVLFFSTSISSVLTITSAIVSAEKQGDASGQMAILTFPLVIGVIWLLVKASLIATEEDAPLIRAYGEIELLGIFSIVMLPISYLLFEFIWEN